MSSDAASAPIVIPRAMVIAPIGGIHTGAYAELAETVFFGLQRLGYDATMEPRPSAATGRTIVIGGFVLSAEETAQLPPDAIIYNTEHFSFISARPHYMDLLRSQHEVWDYSRDNADRLPALIGKEVRYVPLGFVPELARIDKAPVEDIDILFYGSYNPRRVAVLDELRSSGLNIHHAYGVYGTARDELISRAKVVVNIHFYEPGGFEAVRVCYLLANRKAVVTEINPGEFLDPELSDGVLAVPYAGLAEACKSLVGDHSKRRDLEECGFQAIAARDEAAILREALAPPSAETIAGRPVTIPRRLNLGSGRDWRPDYLNIDLNPSWKPDIVADICDPDLFFREFSCSRFGATRFQYDYFDEIVALDVLEHISDLSRAMANCLSLLREGGVMRIHVPYDLSFGAWQDPTHVRAFNERSWWYYCEWFWYLGWTTDRFDLIRLEYDFSPLGAEMKAHGSNDEDIAKTPRAVDQMRVLLRKRSLTSEEQAEGRRLRGDDRPYMD